MKLVLIAYNEAVDEEVMEALDAAGADAYTKWTQVLGKGHAGGPHLLSHVWPKGNHVLLTIVDDERADKILDGVRALRQTAGREGVKAFVLPVEQMT